MIESAPPIPEEAVVSAEINVIFVQPSMDDEEQRLAQFRYWMGTWLREALAGDAIRPIPEPRIVGKGLDAITEGLDNLREVVSCTKLVDEISE